MDAEVCWSGVLSFGGGLLFGVVDSILVCSFAGVFAAF